MPPPYDEEREQRDRDREVRERERDQRERRDWERDRQYERGLADLEKFCIRLEEQVKADRQRIEDIEHDYVSKMEFEPLKSSFFKVVVAVLTAVGITILGLVIPGMKR